MIPPPPVPSPLSDQVMLAAARFGEVLIFFAVAGLVVLLLMRLWGLPPR